MPKPQSLKQLKRIWDKKLADSGFDDLEPTEGKLKSWASRNYTANLGGINQYYYRNQLEFQNSKQEYYRLAGFFLHDYTFKNPVHKKIWEWHSEGKGSRIIAKLLKLEHNLPFNKDNIGKIIAELKKEMLAYGKKQNE